MEYRVSIYYHPRLGYSDDPVEYVTTTNVDASSMHEAAERLFYIYNMAHPADWQNRSMSVNDILVFENLPDGIAALKCEHIGFAPTDIPPAFYERHNAG